MVKDVKGKGVKGLRSDRHRREFLLALPRKATYVFGGDAREELTHRDPPRAFRQI